jgi:hypothetical protein
MDDWEMERVTEERGGQRMPEEYYYSGALSEWRGKD